MTNTKALIRRAEPNKSESNSPKVENVAHFPAASLTAAPTHKNEPAAALRN